MGTAISEVRGRTCLLTLVVAVVSCERNADIMADLERRAAPTFGLVEDSGTFFEPEHGVRFSMTEADMPGGRLLRGLIAPIDYEGASHRRAPDWDQRLVVDGKIVVFPPKKNLAVVSKGGKVGFPDVSIYLWCPDSQVGDGGIVGDRDGGIAGDGGGVRYGLRIDDMKATGVWQREIEPLLSAE